MKKLLSHKTAIQFTTNEPQSCVFCEGGKSFLYKIHPGAAWHKSNTLIIPENVELFYLPPATPEMNPIEQIWKEIRKRGFRNEIFSTLEKVVDRLCDTICSLTKTDVTSITGREWILSCF